MMEPLQLVHQVRSVLHQLLPPVHQQGPELDSKSFVAVVSSRRANNR